MRFLILATYSGYYTCDLEYLSCVALDIAKRIRALGHEVFVVYRPTPIDANNAIKKYKPDVVWWTGHGNVSVTTLEHVKIWISDQQHCGQSFGNANREVLRGVTANALSCLTAACLGKSLTKNYGCNYYLGYYKEFLFTWCECPHGTGCACGKYNPYSDVRDEVLKNAMICLPESNLYFLVGLAKGFTEPQAQGYSLIRFDQWIEYWYKFEPKTNHEWAIANLVARLLNADKSRQVLLRNGEIVQPENPPEQPEPPTPPRNEGILKVLSDPSGALVFVNNTYIGKTPTSKELNPGVYRVKVTMTGYQPYEGNVRIYAGKITKLLVRLTKKGEGTSPREMTAIAPLLFGLPIMVGGLSKENTGRCKK